MGSHLLCCMSWSFVANSCHMFLILSYTHLALLSLPSLPFKLYTVRKNDCSAC
uniref:Uncharacterized protein n=1 Tax=Anguilla anguilla TaxID=7936 RepID=A0A0E9X8W2_ANGAN